MSVYSTLFSQTFFGLLFCHLTITDVTMYLQIIDFQFPSCCTSQPKKTQPSHYCEQFYEDSYHQKNNSCTLCVPMFLQSVRIDIFCAVCSRLAFIRLCNQASLSEKATRRFRVFADKGKDSCCKFNRFKQRNWKTTDSWLKGIAFFRWCLLD